MVTKQSRLSRVKVSYYLLRAKLSLLRADAICFISFRFLSSRVRVYLATASATLFTRYSTGAM